MQKKMIIGLLELRDTILQSGVLIDFGDVVVHVMLPETRKFFMILRVYGQ